MKTAKVFIKDEFKGEIQLSEEEAKHFYQAPECVARVAVSQQDLTRLGINNEEYISLSVN